MIDLYYWTTPNGHKITLFLEETGLLYTVHPINIGKGEQFEPEFLRIAPNNRIPAIVDQAPDDGGPAIPLFESGAILQYLTEREGRLAPRPGEPERADFLEWVHFAETQANILQALNIHHIFLRPESARSVPLMRLDTRRLAVTAQALDAHLAGRETLLSTFSAADCMLGFNIEALFRFLPAAGYPALAAYRDRMLARPAYRRALARAGGDAIYDRDFYEVPDVQG